MSSSIVALKARPKVTRPPRRALPPRKPAEVTAKPSPNLSARVCRGMMLIVEASDAVDRASASLLDLGPKHPALQEHWTNVLRISQITDRLLGLGHCGRPFSAGTLTRVERVATIKEVHAELVNARKCFEEAAELSPQWETVCECLATMLALVAGRLEGDI